MKKRMLVLALALILLLAAGTAGADDVFSEYRGKTVAVQSGTINDEITRKAIGDVKISYYNSQIDAMTALRSGKADYWATDEPVARFLQIENQDLEIAGESLGAASVAHVFPMTEEGEDLCALYSDFVDSLWKDGTMAEIDSAWFGTDEGKRTVLDYKALPAANGTLRMAADTSVIPFVYMKDNRIVGYDVDIAARFCRAYGYRLEVVAMSFDGILPSVQTGKCDFAASCISVTPERAESVLFSSPVYHSGNVLVRCRRNRPKYATFAELKDKRIGVMTGSVQAMQAEEFFPDAPLFYFTTNADLLEALRTDKIDAIAGAEADLLYMVRQNRDVVILEEPLGGEMQVGAVFRKTESGRALCDEFNDFLREMKDNGVFDEIHDIWFGTDESRRVVPDPDSLPAVKGTLRMAVDASLVPYAYVKDGKTVGLDIDTVVRFCQARGYGLVLEHMDFNGVIASVISGKTDFACCGISWTEERAESVYYSDPTYTGHSLVMVMAVEDKEAASGGSSSFWEDIVNSFEKTFIREDRWKLFLTGLLTTLLITLLAILCGTLLGFIVFMLCRNGNAAANGITRVCTWLIQGTPVVVLLMILYYIIFGSVSISGILVAVIGFTLTFGTAVFSLLKMGVGTVDIGQYEAAYALGHSNRHTFFTIILPQAIPHVLPAYKGEIVALIKATSVVGYIAVQDLTKMGDIVRSRTYDAFFPLIAITVIYFGLEVLLALLVNSISVNAQPKRRPPEKILKGVDTHDQN